MAPAGVTKKVEPQCVKRHRRKAAKSIGRTCTDVAAKARSGKGAKRQRRERERREQREDMGTQRRESAGEASSDVSGKLV